MKISSPLACLALFAAIVSSATSPRAAASPPASRPDEEAWKSAPGFPLARPSKLCTAKRLGEWMRLDCLPTEWVFHLELLGGSADDVHLRGDKLGATAVFKVAPGDRRFFTVNHLDQSAYLTAELSAAVVTETWIDGEDAPTISAD